MSDVFDSWRKAAEPATTSSRGHLKVARSGVSQLTLSRNK